MQNKIQLPSIQTFLNHPFSVSFSQHPNLNKFNQFKNYKEMKQKKQFKEIKEWKENNSKNKNVIHQKTNKTNHKIKETKFIQKSLKLTKRNLIKNGLKHEMILNEIDANVRLWIDSLNISSIWNFEKEE